MENYEDVFAQNRSSDLLSREAQFQRKARYARFYFRFFNSVIVNVGAYGNCSHVGVHPVALTGWLTGSN